MEKCEHGWHTGECCCNCKSQITLHKHPWNNEPILKGAILEKTGLFACIVEYHVDGNQSGFVLEKEHGFCELHVYKK